MKVISYWSGTAGEFRNLTFKQWLAQSYANIAIANAAPKFKKLLVKHL